MRFALSLLLFATFFSNSANAVLVITEVMSSSAGSTEDWWELTNTGPASVNLNNYYWDDNGPMGADGALFGNFDIAAGQSIVISNSTTADFQAVWGTTMTVLDQTFFTGPDTFSGLGSGGDQIELWDADPNPQGSTANLVASVTFGAATQGFSFEWDTAGNSLALSVAGENGAYAAGTDVGSPGISVTAVPEPSSFAVLGILSLSTIIRRRRS